MAFAAPMTFSSQLRRFRLTAGLAQEELAERLLGGVAKLREAIGSPVILVERARLDQLLATTLSALDVSTFDKSWDIGHGLTPEHATAAVPRNQRVELNLVLALDAVYRPGSGFSRD